MWVFATELFGRFPECRDRFNVFGEGYDERVDLVVFAHKGEGVVVDGTVKVNVGFYAPIPGIFQQKWMAKEEARVIATHVAEELDAHLRRLIVGALGGTGRRHFLRR